MSPLRRHAISFAHAIAILAFTLGLRVVSAADRYWIGASGNWSDTANWSDTSGGSGGSSEPGASDRAIFDSSSGNGSINKNVSIGGLQLAADYAGTLTQVDPYTLTIGSQRFVQEGGTFLGGTNQITLTHFDRSDGTFTAGAQWIDVATTWTNDGVAFDAGDSTIYFHNAGGATIYISNSPPLNNVRLGNTSSSTDRTITLASGSFIEVRNLLDLIGNSGRNMAVSGGRIEVSGDVKVDEEDYTCAVWLVGTNHQTLTGRGGLIVTFHVNKTNGTVSLDGTTQFRTFNVWQGDLDPGTSTVIFLAAQTSVTGQFTLARLEIGNATTSTERDLDLLGDTVITVTNHLSYNGPSSINKIANVDGGRFLLTGDLTVVSNGTAYAYGTTWHVFTGTAVQVISAPRAPNRFGFPIRIDKADGEVRLDTDFSMSVAGKSLVFTNGTLNLGEQSRLTLSGANAYFSNASLNTTLKLSLSDHQPRISIIGTSSRVYLNGSLELNLAPGFKPAFDDQILIITSTTAVVTSPPFAPFVKASSDIVYDLLYNVGGNNVIVTHIAPANLGVMVCIF